MKKLFKVITFFIFTIAACIKTSNACTTFCLQKDGRKVFGKNYDWVTGTGMVHTNLRGLKKTALSLEEGNKLNWTSLYGSVTFNQFGKEFPNGGMNEKGLVIELMWLNESAYPAKDQRPSLSVLQWIQYQLDNAATVSEVIASDRRVRIFSTGTPQHYLVADANGAVATIEFLNGRITVHQGKDLPHAVLANSTYAASLASLKNQHSTGNNSLQRFAGACEMVKTYQAENIKTPIVDYAFQILEKVSQGAFTKWSIVYDIDKRTIHFETLAGKRRSVEFGAFSFSCKSTPLFYNLSADHHGNVSRQFARFSPAANETLLKKAFAESRSQFRVIPVLQQQMADLAAALSCTN
jgi:choloylglycine hydrolase